MENVGEGAEQMEMKGLDIIGVDFGGVLETMTRAGSGALDVYQKEQTEGDVQRSTDQALRDAINADQAATAATWKSLVSAQIAKGDPSKKSTADADQTAADSAARTQDQMGAAVPESKKSDRVKAAVQSLNDAQKAYDSAKGSTKTVSSLRVQAAQQTLDKIQGKTSLVKSSTDEKPSSSLFSKSLVGPVKVWHGLLAVGAAGVGYLLLRRK